MESNATGLSNGGSSPLCEENDDIGIALNGTVSGKPGNTVENNRVEQCMYGIHLYNASNGNMIKANNVIRCYQNGIITPATRQT